MKIRQMNEENQFLLLRTDEVKNSIKEIKLIPKHANKTVIKKDDN